MRCSTIAKNWPKHWPKHWMRFWFACFLALTVSAFAEDKREFGEVTEAEMAYTLPEYYAEEGAAVLFETGSVEIPQPYGSNKIHFKFHRRCKVFNVSGADDAINVKIYLADGEKIRDLKAQTISADGTRKIEVKGDDIHEQSLDDYKILTFTFPAVEAGCFVEYKYEIRHERFLNLTPWYFQNDLYTKESSFSVIIHNGFEYFVVRRNVPLENEEPIVDTEYIWGEKCPKYTWVLHDLRPTKREPFRPAVRDYSPELNFQLTKFADRYNVLKFDRDWAKIGETFEDYLERNIDNRGDIEDAAEEALAQFAGGSSLDSAKYLYRFVRDNFKTSEESDYYYFDITGTKDLLEERVGTPSGKNLLLVEMMKAAGFSALPLLIGTRDHCMFSPNIIHTGQFNHVLCLVSVEDQYYFLDTQDKYAAFAFLPPECMAAGGLIIDGENSQIAQLTHPDRKTSISANARLRIDDSGAAVCSTHVTVCGHLLSTYRELLDGEIDEESIRDVLLENAENLKFDLNMATLNDYSVDDSVTIDLVLDLPQFCERIEDNAIFEPLLFAPRENPFKKSERMYPVDFRFKFSSYTTTDVTVGDGLKIVTLPEQVRENVNGIQFNRSTFGGGSSMRTVSQLIVGKEFFGVGEYPTLRETFEKVAQAGLERSAAEYVGSTSAE